MKHLIEVTQTVEVELKEDSFNKEFLDRFSTEMLPLDTVEDHVKHLATMRAVHSNSTVIPGYGRLADRGVTLRVTRITVKKDYEKYTFDSMRVGDNQEIITLNPNKTRAAVNAHAKRKHKKFTTKIISPVRLKVLRVA